MPLRSWLYLRFAGSVSIGSMTQWTRLTVLAATTGEDGSVSGTLSAADRRERVGFPVVARKAALVRAQSTATRITQRENIVAVIVVGYVGVGCGIDEGG